MDAKISDAVWSEPDLEPQPAEVLLTLFWIKTHPSRNDCGAYRFSPGRFTSETRLPATFHEQTLAAFPAQFVRDGHWVLYLPFIRECLQLGTVVGKNGGINLGAKALTKPFQALTKPFQDVLLRTYPELGPVWGKPLPSPYQALPPSSPTQKPLASPSSAEVQGLPSAERSENGGETEGLGKGLVSPREEKSSIAQRSEAEGMQGEARGANPEPPCEAPVGALVPDDAEVLAFGRDFRDLARGITGIDEPYVLNWLAWRKGSDKPFPKDWRGDLARRYAADVLRQRSTPAVSGKNRATPAVAPGETRAEVEALLAQTPKTDTETRHALLARLNHCAA